MARGPSDSLIGERLRRGDARAFESFYREQAGRLQSFLKRYVGDGKAAEDIAQEAFLELWQHPNGFNPSRASLKTYLYGIAVRRAADWWRHHPPPSVEVTSAQRASPGEPPAVIAEALAHLEPDARALLWLREVEGYSYAELAEILHIPVGTVRSRLFVAREDFRTLWRGA